MVKNSINAELRRKPKRKGSRGTDIGGEEQMREGRSR